MISDRIGLYYLIDESIDRDLNNEEEKNPRFKVYLKKDEHGNYSLIDADSGVNSCSIKCIFNESGLKEFFSMAPVFYTYDRFNNCQIFLKKYRFDYLTVEMSEKFLAYRVVCYIEEFDIDGAHKTQVENIPRNINLDNTILAKVEKVANNICNKLYSKIISKVFKPVMFDARNFIRKDFSIEATRPSIETIFATLKQTKNINSNNFLFKTEESVPEAWPYLQDIDVEYDVIEKVKNFDYKQLFSTNPTQLQKKNEEQFIASKSNLEPSEGPILDKRQNGVQIVSIFHPSHLVLDIEDSRENIEKYLLRKVKRHRPSKTEEKLPANIKQLITKYGDVCSNITNDMMKKYQYYHNFYSFS